jgi:gliding motility-associated-like protein
MNQYLLVILFSFSLITKSNAQNGCVDSVSFNRFVSPFFGFPLDGSSTTRDSADNLYINGYGNPGGQQNYNIIKFNASNELVWFKIFKTSPFTQITPQGLNAIDKKANLIFCTGSSISSLTNLLKFDSAGNFLWSKKIQRADLPSAQGSIAGVIADNASDIYLFGFFNDDKNKTHIVKLNELGNIQWGKKYGNTDLPKFQALERYVVSQNENNLVLLNHFFYDADNPLDPSAKQGLQIVKINKGDGSILQQKTIMYYNDAGGTNQNYFTLKKINYSKTTGTFLLDSWGQFLPPFYRSHILTTLDDDFNVIKTVIYNSVLTSPPEIINISPNNEILITLNRPLINGDFELSFNYININNSLEIIRQRKINLANLSFPDFPFTGSLAFKKNGFVNFQLTLGASSVTNNPIYLFDNSPFYQSINSNCVGKDTIIYTKGNIYTLPVNNVVYKELADIPFSVTDFTPDPYEEKPFPKQVICKEVSICDTIKLFGTQYHCLSSPLDSFKIIRNPLCKRVTNWQVDTTYIKILNQNDTALYVEYRQPYRGKIKVSFGGCSLTDSINIEVYAPQTAINLGNDTMYCPGKTITLKAGKKFKTYLWQDGSGKDSLVAAQPGQYHVTATDSCGNVFKDTITVKPMDVTFNLSYPQLLCYQDTASITLPNVLYNYTWQPATTATLNGYNWQLFPSFTTTYSITGESHPGCLLKDTILIRVKQCNIYVLFPNSFTPDDNGINDLFKPSVKGLLQSYKLLIYNRYGQLVFNTTDPAQGWNGRFKNSSKPLTGGYVWSCKYQFAGRPVQQEQGTFILIR